MQAKNLISGGRKRLSKTQPKSRNRQKEIFESNKRDGVVGPP